MAACRHHWRLSAPGEHGAAQGECSRCGMTRTFTGGVAQGQEAFRMRQKRPVQERAASAEHELSADDRRAAAMADVMRAVGL